MAISNLPVEISADFVLDIKYLQCHFSNFCWTVVDNNYKLSCQLTFNKEAKDIYDDFCYNYVRERVYAIGEESTDPYNVCMLEFYGKIKVYAEKWAGISMLLTCRIGSIDGEIMAKSIEAMKVFELYAMKVYSFIFNHSSSSSKGEQVRKIDQLFGIKNRAQFADSLGISRSLVSDYLNEKK